MLLCRGILQGKVTEFIGILKNLKLIIFSEHGKKSKSKNLRSKKGFLQC